MLIAIFSFQISLSHSSTSKLTFNNIFESAIYKLQVTILQYKGLFSFTLCVKHRNISLRHSHRFLVLRLSQTITWVYAKIIAIPYSFSPYKTKIPILWGFQPASWLWPAHESAVVTEDNTLWSKSIQSRQRKKGREGWAGVSEILINPL